MHASLRHQSLDYRHSLRRQRVSAYSMVITAPTAAARWQVNLRPERPLSKAEQATLAGLVEEAYPVMPYRAWAREKRGLAGCLATSPAQMRKR